MRDYKQARQVYLSVKEMDFEQVKITSSKDAVEYARHFYHDDISIYESFFCIFLDRNNKTIAYAKISQGGVCGTVVDPKIILKYAIDVLASGMILVHNHPSGNTNPSELDKTTTKNLINAAKYLNISVLDHAIITKDSYYSFADNGII